MCHMQAEAKVRSVMAEKAALAKEVKEVRAALEAAQQQQGKEQLRRRLPNGLGSRTQQAVDKARAPCTHQTRLSSWSGWDAQGLGVASKLPRHVTLCMA